MVFVIIPIGLITSCLRSASRDRESETQYVQTPQRQVVMVRHQQQTYVQNGVYYPACQPPRPGPAVQTQQGGYHPAPPAFQQPPPYYVANPRANPGYPAPGPQQHQQQQQHAHVQPNARQPQQQSTQPSSAATSSGGSHRRKPWQRRSKDGYSYTVLES